MARTNTRTHGLGRGRPSDSPISRSNMGPLKVCIMPRCATPTSRKGTFAVNIVKLPWHSFHGGHDNVGSYAESLAANRRPALSLSRYI